MSDAIAIQSLKTDIALLRQHIHPPQHLQHVEGLPIYYGLKHEVDEYYRQWQPLIERAQQLCQPFMEDEVVDAIHHAAGHVTGAGVGLAEVNGDIT